MNGSAVLLASGRFRSVQFGRLRFTWTRFVAATLGLASNQKVQCRDYQQYRYARYDEIHRESAGRVPFKIKEGYDPEDEK
jgi:hypothetical protein